MPIPIMIERERISRTYGFTRHTLHRWVDPYAPGRIICDKCSKSHIWRTFNSWFIYYECSIFRCPGILKNIAGVTGCSVSPASCERYPRGDYTIIGFGRISYRHFSKNSGKNKNDRANSTDITKKTTEFKCEWKEICANFDTCISSTWSKNLRRVFCFQCCM